MADVIFSVIASRRRFYAMIRRRRFCRYYTVLCDDMVAMRCCSSFCRFAACYAIDSAICRFDIFMLLMLLFMIFYAFTPSAFR